MLLHALRCLLAPAVLILSALLSCSPQSGSQSADAAALETSVAPPPTADTFRPDCLKQRACVGSLLKGQPYETARQAEILEGAWRCFGATKEGAYDTAGCGRGMELGTEAATGLQVGVFSTCSDVCPRQTRLYVGYMRKMSARECSCRRGYAFHDGFGGRYLSCGPRQPPIPAKPFVVSPSPAEASPGYLVTGGLGMETTEGGGRAWSRLHALGIERDLTVLEIDGVPVRSEAAVLRMLEGLTERLPRSLLMREPTRSAMPPTGQRTELRFMTRQDVLALARVLNDHTVHELEERSKECLRLEDLTVLDLGDHGRVAYKQDCLTPMTWRRVQQIEQAITQIARATTARALDAPTPAEDCPALDGLPVSVRLTRAGRDLELRYVDPFVDRGRHTNQP